jgi:FAD/FMN-containing dehydrogenase
MDRRIFLCSAIGAINLFINKTNNKVIAHQTQDKSDIAALRAKLKGTLLLPEEPSYKEATQAWNLNAAQKPALVVVAASAEDVQAAVRFAGSRNMGVGVMATGHGVGTPCNGGLLINTSQMRHVSIDALRQAATVEAGALWKDVIPAAYTHGLATLAGSAPHVGVVGYTMGGGFSYLGRKYGLNSASVISADIVMADGSLWHVSADEHADLFIGVKGGGGNFGIITSLTCKLYPLTTVYGGAVFYPVEQGQKALTLFAQWAKEIPDEITAAFAFMNIPPLPAVPEVLRGRSVVVMKGCYCGEDPRLGEKLFAPLRTIHKPIADTFTHLPVTAMDAISKDPVDPMGVLQYGAMLSDLSPQAIKAFVKAAGAGSGSPLLMVELRTLGGALANQNNDIHLLGKGSAQFSINALGATFTPLMAEKVQSHLALLAKVTKPFQTGEVFLNFLEVEPAEARVRAAYTAEDWDRLVALKYRYDPKNIFRFNRNIPPQL